jgi:hypothetical protein
VGGASGSRIEALADEVLEGRSVQVGPGQAVTVMIDQTYIVDAR